MGDTDDAFEGDDDIERCRAILPAWFVPRMMEDCWSFAFLLATGHTMHFESITDVVQAADGSIWLTVVLCECDDMKARAARGGRDVFAPTSRTTASVNAAHIVAAYETADT